MCARVFMCVCVFTGESSLLVMCVSEACAGIHERVRARACVCRWLSVRNIAAVCLHARYQLGKLSFTTIHAHILGVCVSVCVRDCCPIMVYF